MDATATPQTDLAKNGNLPYSLPLELTVKDQEVIRELWQRPEGCEREEYALAALRLGVLTLRQARGVIDSQEVKVAGDRLFADVKAALTEHQTHLKGTLSGTLQEYFDPRSGRFNERIDRLVKKDGELEKLLANKITASDSEMCRVLSAHVGQGSPIYRLLSPNEAEGVIAALRKSVEGELTRQRERIVQEFSLDNQQGALSRVVAHMCESNGNLQTDLKGKIDGLLKQFSFDDEQSALSRMSKTVETTNQAIANHLTLDDENSALSRLKRELFDLLKKESAEAQNFREEVQKTLERIDVRRKERAASTSHGQDFQSQVYDRILTEAQRLGDFATLVANTPGRIPPRCKTGDVLIELGAETSAPGAKVVAEAKEEKDYKLADARIEIDKARENRDAEGGLFVFSKATAPEGLEPLSRYGQDVFVVWDASDPTTDAYLTLGLSVARALCVHKVNKRDSENADFRAIDDAITEIKKQIEKLEEVRSWTGTIQTNSGKVLKSVENAINTLVKQVENLSTRMEDLKRATTEV